MPSWSDLESFLRRDGWVLVRQNGRDKIYEKTLPEGEILRTAVKEYFNSKK
jgi:predicted RNA binding protein YcfA (HicA-like mRNA interferase family)